MTPGAREVCCAVAFKLKVGADVTRFIALSSELQGWLHEQDGFVRYELFGSDERWMDTMIWRDRASAECGNAAFANTALAARMIAMVEPGFRSVIAERVALDAAGV